MPSLPEFGMGLGASITKHWESKRPPANTIIVEQPVVQVIKEEPRPIHVIHKTTKRPCCQK
jgi:hypothetical protein